MKNCVKYAALGIAAFVIGMSVNNYAISNVPSKIAVVDVQKVVASSSQVKALKADREAKIKDLANFVTTARANVAKETNATKKKELENRKAMKESLEQEKQKSEESRDKIIITRDVGRGR